MAAPKLNIEQQDALRTWLAAEYSGPLIRKWFTEREWPPPTDAALSYYRDKWADELNEVRRRRRDKALTSGLALKAERVQRLVEHADELEAIKWTPDDKGRLWNEKAWRETLDDIAKEMGHRRQGVDVAVEQEIRETLDLLRNSLSPEEYAKVAAILLASSATGATE